MTKVNLKINTARSSNSGISIYGGSFTRTQILVADEVNITGNATYDYDSGYLFIDDEGVYEITEIWKTADNNIYGLASSSRIAPTIHVHTPEYYDPTLIVKYTHVSDSIPSEDREYPSYDYEQLFKRTTLIDVKENHPLSLGSRVYSSSWSGRYNYIYHADITITKVSNDTPPVGHPGQGQEFQHRFIGTGEPHTINWYTNALNSTFAANRYLIVQSENTYTKLPTITYSTTSYSATIDTIEGEEYYVYTGWAYTSLALRENIENYTPLSTSGRETKSNLKIKINKISRRRK